MKKLFSLFLVMTVLYLSVAVAEVGLDYERMTEEELLRIVEELSDKLEDYGYTISIQEAEAPQYMNEGAEEDTGNTEQMSDVLDEYPISIKYARVTNDKGLSTRKDCSVSFKNTSEAPIKRVYFSGVCYNRVDERCGSFSMGCTGPFESGDGYKRFYQADIWRDSAASRIVLTSVRIVYMDDMEIIIDSEEDIERLFVRNE